MKISLIGQDFNKDSGQGISRYCNELYERLKKYCTVQKIEVGTSKNPFKVLFKNLLLSSYKLFKNKSDIYHFLSPEISLSCLLKRPSIITIYDIIPLILKDERKKSYNFFFRIMLGLAKRANHIIVISKSTREDLIKYLKIPEEKISLIYLGVDSDIFFPVKRKKNEKFTIGFLGGLSKRKNAKILLAVAELLKEENIIFKIGGKIGAFDELKKMKENKKLDNVTFAGFIPDKELNKFYNSLDLFIAPTIYDGFCMPGLEAMSCGCPIITSNAGALPEVAGDAGITINPLDAKEIAENILKIKNNPFLAEKMKMKSIKHANQFRWEKCVKETLDVYKKVLANKLN
jgi:glycosyltransferase involved in cell wall biosynthesis